MTLELLNDDADDITALGGCLGALHLFDETPRINPARVRPFIVAILLLRGAVRPEEVIASITPHAHPDDLRVTDDDQTPLEFTVEATLHEMAAQGFLRINDAGLFVLPSTPQAVRRAIALTATLDAQLPDHMLAEVGRSFAAPYQ